jgi:hypothetical protein
MELRSSKKNSFIKSKEYGLLNLAKTQTEETASKSQLPMISKG